MNRNIFLTYNILVGAGDCTKKLPDNGIILLPCYTSHDIMSVEIERGGL